VRRLAKGMSAFTSGRSASAVGRDARTSAGRGASCDGDGSGAPSGRGRRGAGVGLVSLLVVFGLALALAPAALATSKGVAGFFGNPTASFSSLAGQFKNPQGVAVNTTGAGPADAGDIYVADELNNRVQRFNVLGEFVSMWGKDVVSPGGTGEQGIPTNERQSVSLGPEFGGGAVTGGTFTLTFNGQTTSAIAWDATAAIVDQRLESLSNIGTGNVSVTGPAGGPWTVEFVGTLANTDVAQLTGAGAGLTVTGLFPAVVKVTTTTAGGLTPTTEVCTVAAQCKEGVAGSLGGEFSTPTGIAVDQTTGKVYVVERNSSGGARVQAFTGDGQFLWAAGKNVIKNGGAGNVPTSPVLVNEKQTITLSGPFELGCFCNLSISGGNFTLKFEGENTAAIAYNSSAATVQSALEGLANLDPGQVVVTGAAGGPWTVEFTGSKGGTDLLQMTGNPTGLTPSGSSVEVNTTQNGSTSFEGPAEVCTVYTDCRSAELGTKGGEFGAGGPLSSTGGGNGIAVVPAGPANAGNVLVTDRGNNRVQEFTSAGAFVRTFGADIVPQGGVNNVPNNEKQTVTVGASGGTFKLTYNSQTTVALPYNAPATDPGTPGVIDSVQEALNELTSIKPGGSVTVSGGPGDTTGTAPYQVTFSGGNLVDLDVNQITVEPASLLPGPGRTLTCTGGPTSGVTLSYQWLANGQSLGAANGAQTQNYTVQAGDAGKAVQCRVTAVNSPSGNTGSTIVSSPLTVVTASGPLPTPPGSISLTGNATAGSTLTCSAGSWANSPTSYTYQWLKNGSQVLKTETKAATSDTYVVSSPDVASAANFQCIVTATNANGAASKVSSNKATPSTPNPPGAPSPSAPTATATLGVLATTTTTLQGASSFEICANATECKAGSGNGANVGQFATNTPNRIAVDSSGNVYTVENSANFRLQKFAPSGSNLTPSVVNPDVGAGGPSLPLTGTETSNSPLDVAVGPSNRLFVLKNYAVGTGNPTAIVSERRVVELDSSGAYLDTHAVRSGLSQGTYLADNTSSQDIYFTGNATGGNSGVYILGPSSVPTVSMGVSSIGVHSAQLNGLVNPGGPGTPIGIATKYHFEYRKVGAPSWTVYAPDKSVGDGFATVAVFASLSGLEAGTSYEGKLLATKPFSGVESVETTPLLFTTPASQPEIEAAYATERGETEAKLNARINPNGQATTYHFEFGPTAAYGTTLPVPDGSAGSGSASQIFSEPLTNLEPETTYHFRVLAANASGTAKSGDRTFTTRAAAQAPEGRAYELVSPPDNVGGAGLGQWSSTLETYGIAGNPALVGDRFISRSAYGASISDGGFSYADDAALGERTPNGWVNKVALNRPGGFGTSEFAKFAGVTSFSDDLGLSVWGSSPGQISIFQEQAEAFKTETTSVASTGAPALRQWDTNKWEMGAPVNSSQVVGSGLTTNRDAVPAPNGGYLLISGPVRGVAGPEDPTNISFTGNPSDYVPSNRNVYIDDVSAGLSNTFPGAGIRSLANVCTGSGSSRTEIPSVSGSGKVAGAPCPAALPGREARMLDPRGASSSPVEVSGSISNDGSRVFFVAPDGTNSANLAPCSGTGTSTKCPPQLYVRQRNEDGSVTVRWISRSTVPGQEASLMAPVVFEGATPDGSKVFFRTTSPLTPDDPNGGDFPSPGGVKTGTPSASSSDLYMYEFPSDPNADIGEGTLTRISAGPSGTADSNVGTTGNVVRTFGADGSLLYFTTSAPLPGVPGPSDGTITTPGGTVSQTTTKNLYLYDSSKPTAQRWRFVAQLPTSTPLGSCASTAAVPGSSGLGSSGGLFGVTYAGVNCVRHNSDASLIAFFTDARLTADDPDSTSGDVYVYDATTDELQRISAPQGGAAGGTYTCVTREAAAGAQCHGDLMINSQKADDPVGDTLYFESAVPLVPQDENNVYDVYQWKDGTLSLITTGAPGAEPALLLGNDRSGKNVYIATFERLTWEDYDSTLDVYDARLGGGFTQPLVPPACDVLADGCQGATTTPPSPSPASSSVFEGSGNVTETPSPKPKCGKGKVRKGNRCVKQQKKKNAKERKRRNANTDRRAAK
jgi:hypothetical protein